MRSNRIRCRKLPAVSFAAFVMTAALVCIPAAAATVEIPDEEVPLLGTYVRTPQTGSSQQGNAKATVDHSNVSEGYVMVKYTGGVSKIKLQIARSGSATYTYNLNTNGSWEVFPLTSGNGTYTISIYENVSGTQYSNAFSTSISVSLSNSMLPYLYPSQYVNFNANSAVVSTATSLASGAANDLAVVTGVYNYVISNISYDTAKASSVSSGYLPSVDSVLASRKGICFDYAAVMAAMLRSQNIPTQLRVGYVASGGGSLYHAWISVYITDVGWVNNLIYFDGQNWKMMDPTFASSANQSAEIMQFIGNGSNYTTSYIY